VIRDPRGEPGPYQTCGTEASGFRDFVGRASVSHPVTLKLEEICGRSCTDVDGLASTPPLAKRSNGGFVMHHLPFCRSVGFAPHTFMKLQQTFDRVWSRSPATSPPTSMLQRSKPATIPVSSLPRRAMAICASADAEPLERCSCPACPRLANRNPAQTHSRQAAQQDVLKMYGPCITALPGYRIGAPLCVASIPGGRVRKLSTPAAELWRGIADALSLRGLIAALLAGTERIAVFP
jgi:hypothetical protein